MSRCWRGVVALLGGVTLVFGQPATAPAPWTARVWQADDGLPDNRVTGVTQTPDGFLWVATRGGLVRFNGSTFQEFDLSAVDGVVGNGARAMYSDTRGNLWLGGYREEVIRVGPDSLQVFTTAHGMPAGQFTGFADDAEGNAWFAFGGQLFQLKGDRMQELKMAASGGTGGRSSVARDRDGHVWGSRNGRLGVLRSDRFEERFRLESREVFLAGARSGGLWACVGSQLCRVGDRVTPAVAAGLPTGIRVLAMIEDRAGAVWIGTASDGLFRYDGRGVQKVDTSHQQVSSLVEDREGNIWAGTFGGGLNRLRPRAIELIGPRAGLPFESVTSVCQAADGEFWVAAGNGLLARGDGKVWRVVPEGGGAAACVAADRSGRIWVGTRGQGLREISPREGTVRTWLQGDGLPSNSIRTVMVAADDSVWFGTNGPPCLVNLKQGVMKIWPTPEATRNIRALVQDASGVVWIGTSDGQVLRVAGDTLVHGLTLADTGSTSVRCIQATADGSLWIGYAGRGLGVFRDGKFVQLTAASGLPDESIAQIATDRVGSLWLAGARGLSRVMLSAATDVAEARKDKLRALRYGQGEGLPNLQPHYDNAPATCLSRDGRVLLATSLGLLVLTPENLRDNPVPPPVVLERMTIDERTMALRAPRFPLRHAGAPDVIELDTNSSALRLPPEHRRLAFEFAALSYAAPENVQFRFRLEGFDDAWTEAGRLRTAQYSRLAAGSYTFRVIASNDAGVWSEQGATLAFSVAPFFWQTWWFRLGGLGAFTAAVIALVRWVSFRRLRVKLQQAQQQSALFEERTRIARDIHDDLGGSLAHIKLRSELALQDRTMASPADEHLREITGTAQKMLTSLDEIVWAINPGNDTLPNLISYLGQYAVEFLRTAGIRCLVDLPDHPPDIVVTSDVRHHLLLVVKEALTNVVRHAGAHVVSIQVTLADRALQVVIDDDGRGLALGPDAPPGDGLRNMRERMAAVGGEFQVDRKAGPGTRLKFKVAIDFPA
jgi:signal transduction histidine kinase/ligand-binding sensor domain-containing protein